MSSSMYFGDFKVSEDKLKVKVSTNAFFTSCCHKGITVVWDWESEEITLSGWKSLKRVVSEYLPLEYEEGELTPWEKPLWVKHLKIEFEDGYVILYWDTDACSGDVGVKNEGEYKLY